MGRRILVVDDEPEILEVVESRLKANGYDVVTARDGVQAVERLNEALPALIILDVMMPQVDGFKVLEVLKTHPRTSEIPIIMLTSKGEMHNILKAQELKAVDYLIKPFKSEEIMATVRKNLG